VKTRTTIGILGIGAIGTVISYHLQRNSQHELYYFSRTKKSHLNLIIENTPIEIPVGIQTKISTKKTLDWLIICLKEHQYLEAKHWFSMLITSKTQIVIIRNGLHLKTPLLDFTSGNKILECLIDCPTQLSKTGFYQCPNMPILTVAESALGMYFKSLFNTTNININQVKDFKTESWKKLCESATLGAILCLHNDTCRIFKTKQLQDQYRNLMNESLQVARADGAIIESNFVEKMLAKLMHYPETKGSSMLADLRNKKPIELGAKNGMISLLGKYYNLDTPINDLIIRKLS